MVPVATGLARAIQQTGWDVVVDYDKEGPMGEFAVFLDNELIFSRYEQRRLPEPSDIIPAIEARLFGVQG